MRKELSSRKKVQLRWSQVQRLIRTELETLKAERGSFTADEAISYLASKFPYIETAWIECGIDDFFTGLEVHATEIGDDNIPF